MEVVRVGESDCGIALRPCTNPPPDVVPARWWRRLTPGPNWDAQVLVRSVHVFYTSFLVENNAYWNCSEVARSSRKWWGAVVRLTTVVHVEAFLVFFVRYDPQA